MKQLTKLFSYFEETLDVKSYYYWRSKFARPLYARVADPIGLELMRVKLNEAA